VNTIDILLVRANQTWSQSALKLIDLSEAKSAEGEPSGAVEKQLVGVDSVVDPRQPRFLSSSQPPPTRKNSSAHDAVLEGAPSSRKTPSARMAWLYEFDQFDPQDRLSKGNSSAEKAVDKLLSIDGP